MRAPVLVTGGSGFLGAALVRSLVADGVAVRVLDNHWRDGTSSPGAVTARRLEGLSVELVEGDIRDPVVVQDACRGIGSVVHLAYVNGTRFFYEQPDLVLDVAVRGMLNVIDACKSHGISELVVASSSEVYQTPPVVPTAEDVRLVVPDIRNPRYSYGGGKILWELLALHGAPFIERIVVFRPHNVYGPDMGWEHVVPELTARIGLLAKVEPTGVLSVPIQGNGTETRAFVHVDDFTRGLRIVCERGEDRSIYHIGNDEEISIRALAEVIGQALGREIQVEPSAAPAGATPRRCPDLTKLRALGYRPQVPLAQGIADVVSWVERHRHLAPRRSP